MNKSSPLFVRLARLLLTACALLAAGFGGINQPAQAAPAPDGWLPFGSEVAPAAPAVSLVQADAYTITVQAAIPGANVQATTLNARSYAALSGEGFVQGGGLCKRFSVKWIRLYRGFVKVRRRRLWICGREEHRPHTHSHGCYGDPGAGIDR